MLQNLMDNGVDVKKIIIGFFCLIIIIFIFVFLVIYNNDTNEFLIIKEKVILTKKGSKWKQVNEVTDNLLAKKYSVFSDSLNKNITLNYSFEYDSWYYLDSNYKDLKLTDVRIAYTNMFKNVKPADYDISLYEDSDYSVLKASLKNKSVEDFQNYTSKVTFDLDDDGTLDSIYTLTNESLDFSENSSKEYSSIFLARDGKFISFLDKDHSKPYRIIDIIDLDNDGKYEVIVNKGNLDLSYYDSCFQIYKISGNTIKRIMDCE